MIDYAINSNAAFIFNNIPLNKKGYPSSPVVRDDTIALAGYDFAPWGHNNLYPQEVFKAAKKSTIVPAAIKKQVELLVAAGYRIVEVDYDSSTLSEKPATGGMVAEIHRFLERTNYKTYVTESALDLYWFANFFPEVVRVRDKIVAVSAQEAMFSRFSKQNKYGYIEKCYISANWELLSSTIDNSVIEMPVIDRYFDPAEDMRSKKGDRFIYPVSFPSPGATFYQLAPWHSAVESKWLKFSNAIPSFKDAVLKNQMSIKYLVEIASEYWSAKYPNWYDMTDDERIVKVDEEKKSIEAHLTGDENAMKAWFVATSLSPLNQTEVIKYVNIVKIEGNIQDAIYNEDSQEAASHLLYALGIPASLIGNTPGKGGMGAGSGSDVREHLNLYLYSIVPHGELINEVFNNLVFPYNGWGNYKIRFNTSYLSTLNQINVDDRIL
jgi:hypothetical protein